MEFKENISLKDKNWFRTGGNAKFYCEPNSGGEFIEALKFAKENKLEIFTLGEGANILISDEGFDGLVIHPKINHIEFVNDDEVVAGAGVHMNYLIEQCLEKSLTGLEDFSGIPGTVGGSVFINIHYFEHFLANFLINASVLDVENGEIKSVEKDWFEFGYDTSKLHGGRYYLVDAKFKLVQASELEIAYARGRRVEIIKHRARRFPPSHTCGSFFRNFHDNEIKLEWGGKKMIFIAYYLDKLGVKGELKVGDAQVSWQHANMLVNLGNATSSDIINLARKMQELVKEHFDIIPQPECQLVGFKKYPLL